MNIQEIIINFPWGVIAGKSWGSDLDPIVLVFHGIMDNAGSFDRLIPLLPKSFRYICIDLPGHGRSSHFPDFFPAFSINNVIVYKLIAQHFQQKKYTIIGHSYGAQITFTFAQLYPELVEKIVMLDTIVFYPTSVGQYKEALKDKIDFCISLHEKTKTKTRPSYTYEQIMYKLQNQRRTGFITAEAAAALFPRAVEDAGDGKYRFTVDSRLNNFFNPLNDFSYIVKVIKKFPVTCPVLMLLATESNLQTVYFKDVLNVLKKRKNFRIKVVPGSHDVHNNNPEVVAPYVSKFLLMNNAPAAKL